VWVYAELNGAEPTAETWEAYRVGAWLAAKTGGSPLKVVLVEDPSSGGREPRSEALAMSRAMSDGRLGRPRVVLFPASAWASDVAATLAATLETGLVSHCLEVAVGQDGLLEMLVPAFGGLAAITCPTTQPVLVSLSAGAAARMSLGKPEEDPAGVAVASAAGSRLEIVKLPLDEQARRLARSGPRVVARDEAGGVSDGDALRGPSLTSARVVIGVGAGAAAADVGPLVSRLAEELGAAVGATRPAVDNGMAGEELMIGQSGVRVSPDLYLALGISGDLQHTVGVEGAKTVVAVNRDPAAPIFGRADYGVVARLEEFLPLLVEEIEKIRGDLSPRRSL